MFLHIGFKDVERADGPHGTVGIIIMERDDKADYTALKCIDLDGHRSEGVLGSRPSLDNASARCRGMSLNMSGKVCKVYHSSSGRKESQHERRSVWSGLVFLACW